MKRTILSYNLFLILILIGFQSKSQNFNNLPGAPEMLYGDTSRIGVPFAKDPHVIWFKDRYLMYYSVPGKQDTLGAMSDWGIGIASGNDLTNWERVGEIGPAGEWEKNGLAAPSAIVLNGKVHLFYQTYGNWIKDAICHAVSEDGIHFKREDFNPIFRPNGEWTAGRAIDAEIFKTDDKFFLYFATREPAMKIQKIGVASAPLSTDFRPSDWTQLTDYAIVKPEYAWEETCIEGASVIKQGGWYYMFYAGAFNNRPQQIGVAKSKDGIKWEKLSNKPFLVNGDPGTWNSSES
ncbi:MAG: family 43 glycosylhydrolase, partial [Prolixibacteraceae bacterium]|nr:family 43 glycosylhydrolase [Prolixibacteraceae bacterium]